MDVLPVADRARDRVRREDDGNRDGEEPEEELGEGEAAARALHDSGRSCAAVARRFNRGSRAGVEPVDELAVARAAHVGQRADSEQEPR